MVYTKKDDKIASVPVNSYLARIANNCLVLAGYNSYIMQYLG